MTIATMMTATTTMVMTTAARAVHRTIRRMMMARADWGGAPMTASPDLFDDKGGERSRSSSDDDAFGRRPATASSI